MDSDAGGWGSGTAVVIWRFYESIRVVVWVGALRLVSVTEGGLAVEVRGHVCRYDERLSLDGEGMALSQAYPSPTTIEPLSGSVSRCPILGRQ